MEPVFEEIKVEKVSEKISEQLIRLIVDGKLKPGDKLPGERQLIDLLGVGRSSLREALSRLEMLGYIEIHKRKGNFVKSIDTTLKLTALKDLIQNDQTQIIHLYDIRRDIEQANAYNAALHRSEEDLERISNCLSGFSDETGEKLFSWNADQSLHTAIAQATHNFLRVHVISNIFEFSKEFLKPALEETASLKQNLDAIVAQHEDIYRAILDKNPELAREKMDEHLLSTNKRLVKLLKTDKP